MVKRISKPIPERIFERMREIQKSFLHLGDDPCWEWPLSRNVQTGYGQMGYYEHGHHISHSAHRVSLSLLMPSPGPSICALHKCDNRGCFNPAHLEWGTQKDNIQDMIKKGRRHDGSGQTGEKHWSFRLKNRMPKGEQNKKSKLTDDAVRYIRKSNETLAVMATMFGVTETAVCYAKNMKTWKHVQPSFSAISDAAVLK